MYIYMTFGVILAPLFSNPMTIYKMTTATVCHINSRTDEANKLDSSFDFIEEST